jgi:hypothetical protein
MVAGNGQKIIGYVLWAIGDGVYVDENIDVLCARVLV